MLSVATAKTQRRAARYSPHYCAAQVCGIQGGRIVCLCFLWPGKMPRTKIEMLRCGGLSARHQAAAEGDHGGYGGVVARMERSGMRESSGEVDPGFRFASSGLRLLEKGGVEFINGDGPGVRLRKKK
jgi:hypothetical protein